jgi:pheromone shutdown protein TraB
MAGHRRYLEQYLQHQFGAPVLCHESVVGVQRTAAFDLKLKQLLYLTLVLFVGVVSGVLVYHDLDRWLFWAFVVFGVVGLITLAVSTSAMLSAETNGYNAAKAYYEATPDETAEKT